MHPPIRAHLRAKWRSSVSGEPRIEIIRTALPSRQRGDGRMTRRTGECLCDRVTSEVNGEPLRVGICHCSDCRKKAARSSPPSRSGHARPSPRQALSSSMWVAASVRPAVHGFSTSRNKAEIRIGSLNTAPTDLMPTFEIWVKRREPWLTPCPPASNSMRTSL